jgi:ribosomal protein S18 acetylase RimI-like enzyme
MTELTLRLAAEHDRPALARLMIEMQRHYNAPHPPGADIEAQLAALPAGVEILLAARGGRLAGLSAFSTIFPGPGLTGGFFLKDLYVAASDRSEGVGLALMRGLAALAWGRGLSRIDWTVGKDNLGAVAFYDSLGGAPLPDRHFYRLSGEALASLADAPSLTPAGQ